MTYKRKKLFSVALDEKDKLLGEKLAQRYRYSQKELTGYLYMICDKHDLLAGDWKTRLDAKETKRQRDNRVATIENPCEALTCVGDDEYECVWGRDGKTPDIKKIGGNFEDMSERCASCITTRKLKDRLITAETKLAKGIIVDIPSCTKGGRLRKDGKEVYCQDPLKAFGVWRDFDKFCKTVKSGAHCEYLTYQRVEMKGKQFELDEKSV